MRTVNHRYITQLVDRLSRTIGQIDLCLVSKLICCYAIVTLGDCAVLVAIGGRYAQWD